MATFFKISLLCLYCIQNQNCSVDLEGKTYFLTNFEWILRHRFLLVWFSLCPVGNHLSPYRLSATRPGKSITILFYCIRLATQDKSAFVMNTLMAPAAATAIAAASSTWSWWRPPASPVRECQPSAKNSPH